MKVWIKYYNFIYDHHISQCFPLSTQKHLEEKSRMDMSVLFNFLACPNMPCLFQYLDVLQGPLRLKIQTEFNNVHY